VGLVSQLLYSAITELALESAQCNVTTDPPFSAAQLLIHANEAYQDVWEASGASLYKAAGSTLWTGGGTASLVTDFTLPGGTGTEEIAEFLHVWATTTSASTGGGAGDIELSPVDYAEILALRSSGSGLGTYGTPKVYSVIRRVQAADTDTNRYDLYWWPSVAGYYFPAQAVRQFDPFDGGASDFPDVDDQWSRTLALLLAFKLAPLAGRAELVPAIAAAIDPRHKSALERRNRAQLSARQDR